MQFENIIWLLWSLCVNYPLLALWNCTIGKPIALVFNILPEANSLVKKLSPHPQIIDDSIKVSTAKKILLNTNSDGVFMILSNRGKRSLIKEDDKINAIINTSNLGILENKKVAVMTFFICNRKVPDELKCEVFEIRIEMKSFNFDEDLLKCIPSADQLPVVYDKIQELEVNETLPFKAAIAFYYPYFKKNNKLPRYENMMKEIEELIQSAKEYQEQDDVGEMVQEQFIKFVKTNANVIYSLPEVDADVEERLNQVLIIRSSFLYMDESMFKKIIKSVIEILPIDFIKEKLIIDGVLLGAPGNYTTKMNYFVDGKLKRKRMLRFDIDKMGKLKNYISNLY